MGLGRWFYEATAGVEDFAEGADETDVNITESGVISERHTDSTAGQ